MKANLNELRYKATLNKLGYKTLANYNTIPVNTPLFDFWFGYYKQSLSQSVSSNAFDYLKDKVTIIARHDDHFVTALSDTSYTITLPKPNDKTYNVASVNPDYSLNGYDTIVLSATAAGSSGSSGSYGS